MNITTNGINILNNRKSFLNKNNKNKIILNSLNTTLKSKKNLKREKTSLEKKSQHKEKIKISINTEQYEQYHTQGNYFSKKNCQTLSSRPTSFQNNQRNSTYSTNTSNAIHIFKKSLKIPTNKRVEKINNSLAFSNPNIM